MKKKICLSILVQDSNNFISVWFQSFIIILALHRECVTMKSLEQLFTVHKLHVICLPVISWFDPWSNYTQKLSQVLECQQTSSASFSMFQPMEKYISTFLKSEIYKSKIAIESLLCLSLIKRVGRRAKIIISSSCSPCLTL